MEGNNISLSAEALETLLEAAAERGAHRALKSVGLDDEEAPEDVRELRGLMEAFRQAKKAAWQTIVKFLTTLFLGALIAGAAMKLKSG